MIDIQEDIADHMSRSRRVTAALALVANLPTEDIEFVLERYPDAVDCAFHDLLNPEPQPAARGTK